MFQVLTSYERTVQKIVMSDIHQNHLLGIFTLWGLSPSLLPSSCGSCSSFLPMPFHVTSFLTYSFNFDKGFPLWHFPSPFMFKNFSLHSFLKCIHTTVLCYSVLFIFKLSLTFLFLILYFLVFYFYTLFIISSLLLLTTHILI